MNNTESKVLLFFIAIFVIIITGANLQNTELGLVAKRSVDDWAFFGVLDQMYRAYNLEKLRSFLDIGFFSYGFLHFFIQWVLAFPLFEAKAYNQVLFLMRELSLLWVVAYTVVVYKWVSSKSGSRLIGLMCSLALLFQPGMWKEAMHTHPDHMMTFFIVITIVYLEKHLNLNNSKNIFVAAILYALALSSKLQAIIYLPIILIILGWDVYSLDVSNGKTIISRISVLLKVKLLKNYIRRLVVFVTAMSGVYLILNPYLLFDWGRQKFYSKFLSDIKSNATNHFTYIDVSVEDKLNMIGNFYYHEVFLLFILVSVIAMLFLLRNKGGIREYIALSVGCFLVLLYLLLAVNKAWHHYYLTLFVLLIIVLYVGISKIDITLRNSKLNTNLMAGIITLFFIFQSIPSIFQMVEVRVLDETKDLARSSKLIEQLREIPVANRKVVLISPKTPFTFDKLNISYHNVRFIWGPLTPKYAKQGDVIIIRKDDHYYKGGRIKNKTPVSIKWQQARNYLDEMQSGVNKEHKQCGETEMEIIFCRI